MFTNMHNDLYVFFFSFSVFILRSMRRQDFLLSRVLKK